MKKGVNLLHPKSIP